MHRVSATLAGILALLFITPFVFAQSACPSLTRNLTLDDRGDDVKALQVFLTAQGYSVSASGYFDLATQSAVQKWQAKKGIITSGSPASTGWGMVGEQTRAAMGSCGSTAKATTLAKPAIVPAVVAKTAPTAVKEETVAAVSNTTVIKKAPVVQTAAKKTTWQPSAQEKSTYEKCPAFSRTLIKGLSGADVTALQEFFVREGFMGGDSVTGYFGDRTEYAVQKWQAYKGIVSNGTPSTTGYGSVGAKTRAAIAACKKAVTVPETTVRPTSLEYVSFDIYALVGGEAVSFTLEKNQTAVGEAAGKNGVTITNRGRKGTDVCAFVVLTIRTQSHYDYFEECFSDGIAKNITVSDKNGKTALISARPRISGETLGLTLNVVGSNQKPETTFFSGVQVFEPEGVIFTLQGGKVAKTNDSVRSYVEVLLAGYRGRGVTYGSAANEGDICTRIRIVTSANATGREMIECFRDGQTKRLTMYEDPAGRDSVRVKVTSSIIGSEGVAFHVVHDQEEQLLLESKRDQMLRAFEAIEPELMEAFEKLVRDIRRSSRSDIPNLRNFAAIYGDRVIAMSAEAAALQGKRSVNLSIIELDGVLKQLEYLVREKQVLLSAYNVIPFAEFERLGL